MFNNSLAMASTLFKDRLVVNIFVSPSAQSYPKGQAPF